MSSFGPLALLTLGAFTASPASEVRPRGAAPDVQVLILELPPAQRVMLPALEDRLASELGLLGFRVQRQTLPTSTQVSKADTVRHNTTMANAQLGVLLVRVADPGERREARPEDRLTGQIEIWLVDRLTGKISGRRIRVPPNDPQATSLLALRVVELLRASLIELTVERPGGTSTPLPLSVRRLVGPAPAASPLPTRWGVRFGLGTSGSGGRVAGIGPHLSLELALRWEPFRYLALELTMDAALAGPDVRSVDREASAGVGFGAVRFWILWDILRRGRWRPAVGLGGGVLAFWARGAESMELLARDSLAVVGDGSIIAQIAVHLHRHLALRMGVRAGLAIPRVFVTFADRRVATFGAPHLATHLAMEARF